MRTIFLCYEMNPKTGLSEVIHITESTQVAGSFIKNAPNANRIEEWITDKEISKGKVNEFYSIEDFEVRR